ncbi:putative late blight resistance protein homolog r1b-16 [Phtheirospermum japonicum]|uniref:Putative late blight resistance protein homolog r1b-16 n=1 Tax=Phtheirospermum japonicum TaxID=374723 RepID=A0A830BR46_9LAMI|nr:putative late blight resistance protein homolog r1b-16 [Phtheirospermum japonicum]
MLSLKQELERLLHPPKSKILLPKSELESIYHDICYWQSFLETTSSLHSNDFNRVNALLRQIKHLANKLEEMTESYISDWVASESESSGDVSLTFRLFQGIVQIKPKINSITRTLKEEEEKHHREEHRRRSSFLAVTPRNDSCGTMKMVALNDQLAKLLVWLTGQSSQLCSLSIVGMAGIGKTKLAMELYYHPMVTDYFDLHFHVPIGPQYQLKKVIQIALCQLGFQRDEMAGMMDEELEWRLFVFLYGRRYLIVLDDVWNTQAWDDLRRFIPDNRNGSRIIMTTRLLGVAGCASTHMQVPFLNDDESWDLLCKVVFTSEEEPWDPQLEKIGRKIAKNCEGLPLAIIEVGKLLCKTERKVEIWKEIAEREDPLVITIDDDTPISNTLALSYKMLPQHLKSCFLYMGVFPKNYEIPIAKLIKLWVSEEFIEPLSGKSLEKASEEFLDDLVSRSLVLVCKGSSRGKIKTCRIHFVFRNMCISAAQNEKLFYIIKKYPNSYPQCTNGQRGMCFHNNTVLGFKQVHSFLESVSTTRSLLCLGPQHQHPLRVYLRFPSLRVLDAVTIRFYKFPHQVVELVELRYLAITYDGEMPPSISGLCNLVVLIVRRHHESLKSSDAPVYLPTEIWNLRKLRHLQCMGYDLPDPSQDDHGFDGYVILGNLLTLSGVSAHSSNRGVLGRMPNLMKLGILIESSHEAVETSNILGDFSYLSRLELFKCVVVNPGFGSQVVSFTPFFPVNIRKITLRG